MKYQKMFSTIFLRIFFLPQKHSFRGNSEILMLRLEIKSCRSASQRDFESAPRKQSSPDFVGNKLFETSTKLTQGKLKVFTLGHNLFCWTLWFIDFYRIYHIPGDVWVIRTAQIALIISSRENLDIFTSERFKKFIRKFYWRPVRGHRRIDYKIEAPHVKQCLKSPGRAGPTGPTRPGPEKFSAQVGPARENFRPESARPRRILRSSRPGPARPEENFLKSCIIV